MKFLQWFKNTFMEDCLPSEETLARHYRDLSDTAFKRVDPNELTSVAQACYKREAMVRASKGPALQKQG